MGTFSHGIGGDGAGKVPLEKDSVLKTLILEKIVPPKEKRQHVYIKPSAWHSLVRIWTSGW